MTITLRLVSKWVTLNDPEPRNARYLRYFTELVYSVGVKQLPELYFLLLIVYDHIKIIFAIIQRLFGPKKKLITRFDGHRCIDD